MCLIPLAVRYWRFFRWEKMEQKGSRGIFFEVLFILRIGGCLSGYEGWEEDFSAKLGEQVQGVTAEEIERVMEIVNRAAYGNEEEHAEDRGYVLFIYRKVVLGVSQMVRGWKRVIIRLFVL